MFKTQNTSQRIKLSRQLEDTFLSLYDPEKKLPPLNSLRTIRRIMNRAIHVMKSFIEEVRTNSRLSSIVPSYYEDDLKFIDALFKALRKTNIKLAFTPSKVPPKEYDNMDVLYYHGQDIEKEDPMIVENADDYIYTPTLNSENKDPLPSTAEQTTDKSNVSDDPIKLDEDWVFNSTVKEYLKDKERKVSHPDEDLLIRITKLIFEWCETVGIDLRTAKYHILAELYSMMRRFIMHRTSEEKKENKNQTSDEKENTKEKEDKEEMPILEKLYRATRNPTIFMSNERLFELFPIDDRIEFLQDEIRSYCCKLAKEDEEDKEDYYKYLLDIYKSIKQREKETDE